MHNIKGVWRYYESIEDTVNKGEGGLYLMFSDTSVIMLSGMGGMLTPIGEQERYTFKNDSLTTSPEMKKASVKIFFHNANFISYLDPIEKKARVYLKREKE
jgi:hypothetical protein